MGGITGTLGLCWRIAAKDRTAEVGAGAVVSQGYPGEQPGQGRASQDASDPSEGLTTRGCGSQDFGQFVKLRGVHLHWLLSREQVISNLLNHYSNAVNFADYSEDELFSLSPIDQSSHCCDNRFSAEERAKFYQGNLKIYTSELLLQI